MRCTLLLLTALTLACASEPTAPRRAPPEPAFFVDFVSADIQPAGMSHYCNKVSTGTGGWTFTFGSADPCATGTGTITRAGMYSTRGRNKVLVWCKGRFFRSFDGSGFLPLQQAHAAASTPGLHQGECVFTAAPASMPIFDWPHNPLGSYPPNYHGSGFDFERAPYGAAFQRVDYRGQSVAFLDEHDAHDFGMVPGTPLRAVADGVVIVAGMFRGNYTGCNTAPGLPTETGLPDCGHQGIVIVRHTAKAALPAYDETFATGYFHIQAIPRWIRAGCTPVDTSQLPYGKGGVCQVPVTAGQIVAWSGRRGTSQAHLHFATWRLSNTTRRDPVGFRAPDSVLHVPSCCNAAGSIGPSLVIEPYGWRPTSVTDPWAWKARHTTAAFPRGAGALSIRLWKVDPPIHW